MQAANIRIDEAAQEDLLAALLENFVGNFEEAAGDRVFQQLMISAPPVSTGSARSDRKIVETAIRLATAYKLRVPNWTRDKWRLATCEPFDQEAAAAA